MGSRDRQYSSSTGRDPSNGEETAESGGASYSHAAEQAKTNEEGKTVESKKCSGGRSSAGYALEAQATADRNDMSLGTFCFSPPAPASCCGATPLRHESSATPPLISSYYPRTVLFPSDRALVLFVLRHHPTYYTTIRRCGIKEIYVSWEASSTRFTGALPTAVVDHHTETRHITTTTTTSTITTTANIGKEAAEDKEEEHKKSSVHSYCGPSGSHPVLLVEYVCGAMSPCYTWSECFLSSFPFTLQGYQRMV